MAGEDLRLKVIIVGLRKAQNDALYWRPLGKGTFEKLPLEHIARSVYSARIPASRMGANDIEYYVEASAGTGRIRFPATAPVMNQTVVVVQKN